MYSVGVDLKRSPTSGQKVLEMNPPSATPPPPPKKKLPLIHPEFEHTHTHIHTQHSMLIPIHTHTYITQYVHGQLSKQKCTSHPYQACECLLCLNDFVEIHVKRMLN